jgi:hypothetical protein
MVEGNGSGTRRWQHFISENRVHRVGFSHLLSVAPHALRARRPPLRHLGVLNGACLHRNSLLSERKGKREGDSITMGGYRAITQGLEYGEDLPVCVDFDSS